MTPVLSSDFFWYGPGAAGGGGGAAASCSFTWDSTVTPVPAMPPGASVGAKVPPAASVAILLSELALRSRFVELRVIEFIETILGEAEQFGRSRIGSHKFCEVLVLLLTLLCCLCYGLIQGLYGILQRLDVGFQSGNAIFCFFNNRLCVGDGLLERLLLIISHIKLLSAVLAFVIIILLLGLQ